MFAPFRNVKTAIESISGSKIYRNSLPFGIACSMDIDRRFGRDCIRTIFDVGANAGQSALTYVREFPHAQIHCFEPVAATYQKLLSNIGSYPNVCPHNIGMARKAGRLTINVNPNDCESSISLRRAEDHPEWITVDTVAGFADEHNVRTIDFLKIDTEGYDLEVLAGAEPLLQEQRARFIQCECEPTPRTGKWVSFSTLAEFLEPYGYRLFAVYDQQPDWGGEHCLIFWNAVFICDQLARSRSTRPRAEK